MKTALAAAASTALALTGLGLQPAAQAAPGQTRACFHHSQAVSYQPVDNRTIVVNAGRRAFRIDLENDCRAQNSGGYLVVEPVGGLVCGRLDIQLSIAHPGGGREACIIRDIQQISTEEARALRRQRG